MSTLLSPDPNQGQTITELIERTSAALDRAIDKEVSDERHRCARVLVEMSIVQARNLPTNSDSWLTVLQFTQDVYRAIMHPELPKVATDAPTV